MRTQTMNMPSYSTLSKTFMAVTCILLMSACSNMNDTQQRTLSGAGIGAGTGAAAAAVTGGCVSCGAAIGAGVGAAGGYIYDQNKRDRD